MSRAHVEAQPAAAAAWSLPHMLPAVAPTIPNYSTRLSQMQKDKIQNKPLTASLGNLRGQFANACYLKSEPQSVNEVANRLRSELEARPRDRAQCPDWRDSLGGRRAFPPSPLPANTLNSLHSASHS